MSENFASPCEGGSGNEWEPKKVDVTMDSSHVTNAFNVRVREKEHARKCTSSKRGEQKILN